METLWMVHFAKGKPSTTCFSSRLVFWEAVSHALRVFFYRVPTDGVGSGVQDPPGGGGNRLGRRGAQVRGTCIDVGPVLRAMVDGWLFYEVIHGPLAVFRSRHAPIPTSQVIVPTLRIPVTCYFGAKHPNYKVSTMYRGSCTRASPPICRWVQSVARSLFRTRVRAIGRSLRDGGHAQADPLFEMEVVRKQTSLLSRV